MGVEDDARAAGLGLGGRRASSLAEPSTSWSRTSARSARSTGRATGGENGPTAGGRCARRSLGRTRRGDGGAGMSDEAEAGHVLGRLLRRLRDLRSSPSTRRSSTWPRPSTSCFWPCATDGKVRDVEKMPTAASTSACSTAASAPASRSTWPNCCGAKSKVLVAFGSCAQRGLHPRPGQHDTPAKQIFDTVYQRLALAREPAGRPPAARDRRCPRARCTCRSSTTR